jgi:phosphate starvation-inducible PhoH-like protein
MERLLITVPPAIPMVALVGAQDANMLAIEAAFPSVNVTVRGNEITLRGPHIDCIAMEKLINEMMVVIRSGQVLTVDAVKRSIAMLEAEPTQSPAEVLSLNIVSNRGRTIRPKTANQKLYVDAIEENTITFGIGPAGTGKTYLAMAKAVAALQAKKVNRIILSRPAVEAGEKLGFLPGTLGEKIDPYLRPLFDALHDMIDVEAIPRLMQTGVIEVAPLAFMRGRTLNDAFIILDEGPYSPWFWFQDGHHWRCHTDRSSKWTTFWPCHHPRYFGWRCRYFIYGSDHRRCCSPSLDW